MAQISTPPMASMSRPQKITYEEFLRLGDETHAEWVDGEVVFMSPVCDPHSATTVFLISLLNPFVESKKLGALRAEPFQTKLGPELPGRSPDVLFVSSANLKRLKRSHLDGPPDLVIEVISPESRARDRGDKFYEYEQAGVREYWLIDPDRKQAEFYLRDDAGIYQLVHTLEGIFRSQVLPGLWIKTEWLWTRPPTLDIFKEWRLT